MKDKRLRYKRTVTLHVSEFTGCFVRHLLFAGFKRSGLAAARAALDVPTPSPATVESVADFLRPEPFTCEAPHDRDAVLSTDSASGCPGVRPRWHSPRSRHSTAVRPLHPDGCSKRAVPERRMVRLGCPKKRSLHAKGLTPQDHGLQSP